MSHDAPRAELIAEYRESVRTWAAAVAAADLADNDREWALARSNLNRAETELAALEGGK